ncbi:CHASE3 domain-containing protein [[Phormidium] sp. ETS-05]|uniref:CHASE3 domain-containing protein n=1 Tax=[Phormidium] sp. ETS-05 TaxID=222819 RepID=UPI0018EEE865|nr:CHASE3 domain-containing protein [[Phormidium] sp. ETS-05]
MFDNGQLARERVEELDLSVAMAREINFVAIQTQIAHRSAIAYLIQKDNRVTKSYADAKKLYREKLQNLEQIVQDEEQKKRLDTLEPLLADMEEFNEQMIDLVNQGKEKEAIEIWKRQSGVDRHQAIGKLLDEIVAGEEAIIAKNKEVQDEALKRLIDVVLIVTVLSVLVSISMGWVLISGMVGRMNREAQAIAAASIQIASTVEEQERVAAQQASSVNQTTTTMHELSASSRQSAQQAEAAATSARQIMVLASGAGAAEDHFQSKSSLKDKSKQIAAQVITLSDELRQIYSITTVVSEIANQTNMLAINAAVEGGGREMRARVLGW